VFLKYAALKNLAYIYEKTERPNEAIRFFLEVELLLSLSFLFSLLFFIAGD
jgi:hypothetical protein